MMDDWDCFCGFDEDDPICKCNGGPGYNQQGEINYTGGFGGSVRASAYTKNDKNDKKTEPASVGKTLRNILLSIFVLAIICICAETFAIVKFFILILLVILFYAVILC